MAEPPLLRLIVTAAESERADDAPSPEERVFLRAGLGQPGGKLPLFDDEGRPVPAALIRGCIARGWAAPWFENPLKPGWLVCKLTDAGRAAVVPQEETP